MHSQVSKSSFILAMPSVSPFLAATRIALAKLNFATSNRAKTDDFSSGVKSIGGSTRGSTCEIYKYSNCYSQQRLYRLCLGWHTLRIPGFIIVVTLVVSV